MRTYYFTKSNAQCLLFV